MMWSQMFLSPGLLEISVPPPTGSNEGLLSHLEAAALLRYIGTTCRGIQRLSIFPDRAPITDYKKSICATSLLMEFWDGSLAQHLAQFDTLRSLCTTTEALGPSVINQLAQLPNLESLVIYPSSQPLEPTAIILSSPFPALRAFSLEQTPYSLFSEICKLQILRRVASLRLVFTNSPDDEDDEDGNDDNYNDSDNDDDDNDDANNNEDSDDEEEESLWAISLITLVWNNCPELSDLSIDFDCYGGSGDFVISLDSIKFPMKGLPLQKLSLRHAVISAGWDLMPSVWPQLEVLELPRHWATPDELLLFARLPRLETLVVKLSLTEPLPKLNHSLDWDASLHFSTLRSSTNVRIKGDIYNISQWLLSLWPALERIERYVGPDNDDEDDQTLSELTGTTVLALNRMIDMLREINKTKLRIAAKPYAEDALKLFSL
ncbi:hypothetical protein RhiJN_26105 [Ceratobasidium sp. AG-Ba]|nr:hypothetical protein RhiJN_26105 [Ceratobasidium sp. AG-Ba]